MMLYRQVYITHSAPYLNACNTLYIHHTTVFNSGGPAYRYTIRSNLTMETTKDGYRGFRVPQTERVTDTSFRTPYSTDNFQGYDIFPANQVSTTSTHTL
jgi:hypothetical protein